MRIKRIRLASFRAFNQIEFELDPKLNLLVGVNGVGKTTVLDALRICLSQLLPRLAIITLPNICADAFTVNDIQIGARAMSVEVLFEHLGQEHEFIIQKHSESSVADKPGSVRQQTFDTPDKELLRPDFDKSAMVMKGAASQPLALFFSTRRSLVSDAFGSKARAAGGQAAAFADALSSRELRLVEFATWMHAQESLVSEFPQAERHLSVLRDAARRFLPDCSDLQTIADPKTRLLIRKAGRTLDVRQLSDGERGMLALVLDLARRLAQANPTLTDPVKDGKAIVLIDELDMHMHPLWQREITALLTTTFPSCQFIATTHSPQVISETQPESLILLRQEAGRIISQPCGQAYGLDANFVLEHIMGTPARAAPAQTAIDAVDDALETGDLEAARKLLTTLRSILHGDDPAVVGFEAEINNLRALGDATDIEEA